MNVLLIAPASGKWRHVGRHRIFNGRTFRFSLLGLLRVAAETPEDVEITLVDEQIEEIPWEGAFDLVGITCMTALALRAYEIAARFRARGIPVVLGGMHPTGCPEEALRHADAVVAGEAEGIWPAVIEDARCGKISGVYRAAVRPDLAGLKPPRRDLLHQKHYATAHAVEATRGCPHRCAFCSVSAFHEGTQRKRPVEDVVREVVAIPEKFFVFVDDNLTADREYAGVLFDALAPLDKYWITQSTLNIADDPGFVQRAADAGCIGLFVGLETFNNGNLNAVDKTFNQSGRYKEAVQCLHSFGIGVEAGIVFGFEGDRETVFAETLQQLDDLEIDAAQISIFTPLPGTLKFKEMSGRILDRNWEHYDFHHAVFQPQGMSVEALQAGHDWVTREFYRPWRIARRLARWVQRPRGVRTLAYAAAVNLAYYGRIRTWNIRGWNPAEESCFVHPCRKRTDWAGAFESIQSAVS